MKPTSSDRWARLRFLVVGPLLAAPPALGELRLALAERTQMQWTHPISGTPVRFGHLPRMPRRILCGPPAALIKRAPGTRHVPASARPRPAGPDPRRPR
jgi:hypothetical protein